MSSSLSSIILIGVVWLLIVATLFVRRHNPVRRTTRVLSETRVVHEGGTDLARPRRRPLPAESLYQADPDAAIELVDAEPEQVVIDDTQDDAVVINDAESDSEPEARPEAIPAVIEGDVVEYRTLDDEDTGEFAPVSVSDRPECEVAADAELTGADVVSDEETEEISAELPAEPQPEAPVLRDVSAAADGPRLTVIDDAYLRGSDIDTSVIAVDDLSGMDTDPEAETNSGVSAVRDDDDTDEGGSDDLTDDDVEYAESRRGRGIYDPVASRALAEHRRRRRFRVLAALGVVTVLLLIAAVLAGGLVWIAPVIGVALSGAYLYSLRKQTVAERELEHRRLSRMRRARLGVRNTDDGELGVPDRLRRPGAVVLEIDDADPEFAELDYAEVTFAVADAEPAVEDLPAVRVI